MRREKQYHTITDIVGTVYCEQKVVFDRERGDVTRALARYNGSLGRLTYPNKIYAAMRRNWIYNGAV